SAVAATTTTARARWRRLIRTSLSTEDAGVAEGVAAGLGPDAEAVRTEADRDAGEQAAVSGRDRVDDAVVATGEPEHPPVGRDVAHVGTAAAGDVPAGDEAVGLEADQRDRARASVAHVEVAGVAARVEAVRAGAGADEARDAEAGSVDLPDAASEHVGDVEEAAVGRELDVLGRAAGRESECAEDVLAGDVDLDELARELAACEQVGAVGGEVHVVDAAAGDRERAVEAEAVRVAEVESGEPLGDDDRVPPVWGEVHVVRVGDGDRAAAPAGRRVDSREAVALVVRHVEGAQVVGGDDVLRERANWEALDDPEGPLVDHVDGAAERVRYVDKRPREAGRAGEAAGCVGRVDVGRPPRPGPRGAGSCPARARRELRRGWPGGPRRRSPRERARRRLRACRRGCVMAGVQEWPGGEDEQDRDDRGRDEPSLWTALARGPGLPLSIDEGHRSRVCFGSPE